MTWRSFRAPMDYLTMIVSNQKLDEEVEEIGREVEDFRVEEKDMQRATKCELILSFHS